MKIYHYHAVLNKGCVEEIHYDGILSLRDTIKTMDDYHRIKRAIIGDESQALDPSKLVIYSLTPLP